MSRKVAATHPIAHFDDFLIYHLLDSGGNAGELENFFQNTVGKLVSFDEENNTDLVKTLEAFFASRGNISSAAKELFIHRNTMMYRLDRIKLILGVDLADPEQLLELNLGLKIMNLLTVKMDSHKALPKRTMKGTLGKAYCEIWSKNIGNVAPLHPNF